MADRVSALFKLVAIFAAVAGTAYAAGPSSDPTRPPTAALAPGGADTMAAPAGLQTVMLRKGAKPMAVINGETVELGGRVGDARLVRLSETEAVLSGPGGREVLRLAPAVEKKLVIPHKPVAPRKQKSKQNPPMN